MHRFDYSIPQFITRIRGICMVVTPGIVFEVLHVLRVAHLDYPSYERLRTVSINELLSLFYETPSSWGSCQNTLCLAFIKGLRILNMVMTFVLHPLTITLSQSLVLSFCYPSLRISLLTSLLTLYSPLWMSIRIQRPMISSFFLRLSRGSFATFLSPIPSLPTSRSCVPLIPFLLSRVLHNFA